MAAILAVPQGSSALCMRGMVLYGLSLVLALYLSQLSFSSSCQFCVFLPIYVCSLCFGGKSLVLHVFAQGIIWDLTP